MSSVEPCATCAGKRTVVIAHGMEMSEAPCPACTAQPQEVQEGKEPEETTLSRPADPSKARRRVLPLSSGGAGLVLENGRPLPPLPPNERATITSTLDAGQAPFRAERLVISMGTGPWAVHEIAVDGVVQPIAAFHSDAASVGGGGKGRDLSEIAVCTKDLAISVSYLGDKPDGDHLYATVIGR